jgi:LysR family glycine cleavage system transcriptional activator
MISMKSHQIMSYRHIMTLPRRFLPSISSLRALEALDRLGSATAAAEELAQTQGAVSRQIQALEAQLGVDLVHRDRRRMRLTPQAAGFAAEVRAALRQIGQAWLRLTVNPGAGTLNLAILPTFGMRWLLPRLGSFTARHPEVTVNMSTRLKPFDLASESFVAALHFGASDWPGTHALRLRRERVIAVGAPAMVEANVLAKPADLMALPLLQIESRPRA